MKIKKNIKKATVGLLASAMAISGAFAWLTNSETASKQNNISVGTSKVIFEDGTNVINLTDNLAIPMTNEYAVANLTPYTFKVSNRGTVDMEYSLTAVNEAGTTIDPSLVMLQLDGRTPITLAEANLMLGKKIAAGTSDNHSLIAYIKETGTIDNVPNRVAKFHLELTAVQTDMSVLPTVNMSYTTMSKSQIATSITAGGETKNVEVYNIEGDSKTELLNKLQESGLANPSEVDALVEVKGEDYNGLNSTATFDVSSVANPGDKVVILHFNETSNEWEYVGEETVGEDNTVSGDFTSYSPVAFIVISNNGGSAGGGSDPGVVEPENPGLTAKMYYAVPTKIYDLDMIINESDYEYQGRPSRYEEYTGTVYKYTLEEEATSEVMDKISTYPDKNFYTILYQVEGNSYLSSNTLEYGENFSEETPVKVEEIKIGDTVTRWGRTGIVKKIFKTTGITEAPEEEKYYVSWRYNIAPTAPVLYSEDEKNSWIGFDGIEESNFAEYTGDIYKIELDSVTPQGIYHSVSYVDRAEVEVKKYVDESGQYSAYNITLDDENAFTGVGAYQDDEGNWIYVDQLEETFMAAGTKVR